MLHKSFKPAKCKTALKLAASRIKLLKNKRDAQVKQLKRELAQLLETGQDQTARIRVEHVVREEKTMAAYDLIEIYCELIVARLSIIESQKNCPIDLKEAIASVIFASPRCADIPELMDVRKHFTAKYGKEFVSASVELRPDCGVSRLLVEKLSAKSPDGPTKIKILSAIAEEHNVKWDPTSFGEKDMKPHEDLLNGPNTFEQASKMHVEAANVQERPNSFDKGHPNFKAPSNYYEKHENAVNSYASNSKSSPHSQNVPFPAVGTSQAMPSGTSNLDPRSIGTGSEEIEFRHSFAAEQSGFSVGMQSWNMEFKDATAAAQAAAESAERASMAARAAAELSSQERITRQHPTESRKASVSRSRDEGLQTYGSSRVQGEYLAKDPVTNTPHRNNSGMNHEQSFENEQDDLAGLAERFNNLKSTNKPSQLESSKSSSCCVDDYTQGSDFQMADRHFRKNISELERSDLKGEANIKGDSSDSEVELVSELHDGMRSENFGYFGEASIRRQSSSVSSHTQIPNDDHLSSFSDQKFSEEAVREPSIFDEGNFQRNSKETNPLDNGSVVFDDSGSDDDEFNLDEKGEHNGQDSGSYYLSEDRKSLPHLLANTNANSSRLNMEESLGKFGSQSLFASDLHTTSVFSEGLTSDTVPSQSDELLPVTFDDSDGPSSESEEELNKSKLVGNTYSGTFPHKHISSNTETTQNERPHFVGSSLVEKENAGSNSKNQGNEVGPETDMKFNYGYLHTNPTSRRFTKSQSKSNDDDNPKTSGFSSVMDDIQSYQSLDTLQDTKTIKESSLESGKELNFGILTGGLRNKGYRHPPYRSNPSDSSSVSKQAEEDNSTRFKQKSSSLKVDIGSGVQDSYNQMVHPKINKKGSLGTSVPYSDAIDDESDEELPQQTQEPHIRKAAVEVNKKSGVRNYFDLDNSDSEEDLPKQTEKSKTHSGPGFSRRTKQTVTSRPLSNSERNLKSRVPSDSSMTPGYAAEHKSSSVSSYTAEAQVKPTSQEKSSGYWGSSEQGRSTEQAISKPILQSKRSLMKESSSRSSYTTDTQHNPQSKNSDNQGSFEQRKSAESSKLIQESKRSTREENLKSSAKEQTSNPPPRTVSSGGGESKKTSSSKADTPSRGNSFNKASHVHPKLPDYDTLTAHLLSLRQNRQ
ncbi:hypothetical protein GH714_038899 [Hevea brasiliensis]|uniref:IST1-like protein n=1 Tax=Hevea brasiliensis TaxID=3981 RepID=A0A6A6K8L8_HEVBR|nr:hypothetical protein GH714_038899 [Hevea brasiliensis]